MKYNFIVISNNIKKTKKDLYYYAFREANRLNNSIFDYFYPNNNIFRFFFSPIINKIINLPFKKIFLEKRIDRYSKIFQSKSNICFLLFQNCIRFEKYGFSRLIRKKYPNSKIVYFFQDLVKKDKKKEEFLNNNRNIPDLIYSYDYGDAKKYNLKFHNIPYSDVSGLFSNVKINYDISFVGQAKDRLDDIISAYKTLKGQGLKCGFFIVGATEEQQILKNEINYCDFIPYKDYLKIVAESKCMLEIMQKGGTGNTIRVSEAIAFDKLLISNNKMLLQNSFYDSKYMRVYENLEEIDVKVFIEAHQEVHYENKEKIYPSTFFKQIEKDLNELDSNNLEKKK